MSNVLNRIAITLIILLLVVCAGMSIQLFYVPTDDVLNQEQAINAKFERCKKLNVCDLDCAVIITGAGARSESFAAREQNESRCRLTNSDGKLLEVYPFEQTEEHCADGTGTSCSGVKRLVGDPLPKRETKFEFYTGTLEDYAREHPGERAFLAQMSERHLYCLEKYRLRWMGTSIPSTKVKRVDSRFGEYFEYVPNPVLDAQQREDDQRHSACLSTGR